MHLELIAQGWIFGPLCKSQILENVPPSRCSYCIFNVVETLLGCVKTELETARARKNDKTIVAQYKCSL